MGRAYYDAYRFDRLDDYQPPSVDSYASVDDAGPIGAVTHSPRVIPATRCYCDAEGDWVYGDEVPLLELSRSTYPWRLPQGTRSVPALVFETNDSSLQGHSVTYTEFPYSRIDRGYARLKGVIHQAKNEQIWQEIEDELKKDEQSIDRIFDRVKHDLWRSAGDSIRAYIFQPLQDAAAILTNRKATDQQFKKARKLSTIVNAERPFPEDLPPGLAAIFRDDAIKLYGIVADYDAALTWLYEHESTVELLELAENGGLFHIFETKSKKTYLPQAARDQALPILRASAHNVLCGTFNPAEYRDSVESKRNPGSLHKQTLATHLKHLFLDTMDNFRRRKSVKDGPHQFVFEDLSQHQATALETFDEQIERLTLRLEDDLPQRSALVPLTAALRSDDEGGIVAALAMTVALHELGQTDSAAIEAIRELNANLGGFDESIRQVIRQAVARLPQP